MENRLYILVLTITMSLLCGCVGRPPAPTQYGNSYGTSTNRPPLPGHNSKPTQGNRPPLPSANNPSSKNSNSGSTTKITGQEIFQRCNPAVFMVFTSTGYEGYQGSGFFISSDGLAVSNYHVFEGTGVGLETIKLSDDRTYKLRNVLKKDKDNDVIIFQVDIPNGTTVRYLPLSNRAPQVGDKAYAIGSPRGLENTFSSGEISQIRDEDIIQISVPIDHGSSGGALINEYGEAIGITSAGLDDSGANLNFAISTNVVKRYLNR